MNPFTAVFRTWTFAQGFGVSAPCSLRSVLYLLAVTEHRDYLPTLLLLPLSFYDLKSLRNVFLYDKTRILSPDMKSGLSSIY